MMTRSPVLLVVVAGSLLAAGEPEDDLAMYQGVWVLVSEEFQGKQIPPDQLEELTCTVRNDKILYRSNGKIQSAIIMLDPNKTPKSFSLLREDGHLFMKGIYELKSERIKICAEDDQGDRPKEFKTGAGSKNRIRVWKRLP